MPVRRSERRAGFVNRSRPVQLRRRAPIFQVVRSGLLRFKRAWLSVRIRSSPTSRGGSSTVEHVNTLCSVFSWDSFSGSEDEATSPPRRIAAASPFPPARWDAKMSAYATRERRAGRALGDLNRRTYAQATSLTFWESPSSAFLPKLFLGSEGEVTSLLTKPCRGASHGALRLYFSQNSISEAVSARFLR